MRPLFTDGANSAWHVIFGAAAAWIWWITPLFVLYQLQDPFEKNILIDLGEFAIGWGIAYVYKIQRKGRWIHTS